MLFKKKFPDSGIAERFTLSRQKAAYVICDGLSPWLGKEICSDVQNSTTTFALMFDETKTIQNWKQMDVLLKYFFETTNLVETRYLLSFFLERTPADFVVEKFQDLQNDEEYNIPWDRLFSISSDGDPNINKSIWQLLNELCSELCTLHKIHNAFHKGLLFWNKM